VPDLVYALALCRGDINASACKDCVTIGFEDAQQLCAFNKEATVYYDSCLVSFSNEDFLSTTVNGNENEVTVLMDAQNFTESADYIRLLLFTLLNDTSESAINSIRRFTTARMDISSLPTIYCAVQCTPDLTADECAACLQDFPQVTLQYLDGQRGGRLLGVRCNMRYEIYKFYQGDPMLRIISLASAVPTIGKTPPGTPVTVYPQPPPAAPPAPQMITTPIAAQEETGISGSKSQY
jgi:hypothetical protein